MLRKVFLLGVVSVLALSVVLPNAVAKEPKAQTTAANYLAVCGCGKVFVPSATTKYVTYQGKRYACCTDACHEMASKDPAAAAKMSEKMTAQTLAQLSHLNLGVANVIAVTEKGTKAICGCGKQFYIDETTEYLKHNGKSYACCTHACHEMAAKDPAASVKSFEKQLSAMEE